MPFSPLKSLGRYALLVGDVGYVAVWSEGEIQEMGNPFPMYPEPAIRELIANVVIHQDFTLTGTGPMVEVFDARLEITNPGEPLVDTLRFLDTPPRSRNEALASFR